MGFFSRYKKIWMIVAFLGVVALLAYLIWNFFFSSPIVPTDPLAPGSNIGGLNPAGDGGPNFSTSTGSGQLTPSGGISTPTTGFPSLPSNTPSGSDASDLAVGGITKVTVAVNSPVLDPFMTSGDQLRYYNQADGKFYRLGADGQPVSLSDTVFHKVSDLTWSEDGSKAILVYPDGSKISYNFNTGKQVTLPKHWEDFSFSPDGNRITAKSMGDDVENRHLIVSNSDGSKTASLSAIGNNADDVYPVWSPNNQVAAMYTRGVDFNRQEVFFVGLNGENFKSTIINGRDFRPLWSDAGDKLLYSVYSSDRGMMPSLWVVNAQGENIGQNRTELGLTTWSDKCTFATNSDIYCAVPEILREGAGLFPELADQTRDLLYKIDLTTGAKKLIAIPQTDANISNIMVSGSQDTLYYTDKFTGRIYSVQLR
ncbi:hypothetical protein CVU83_02810 [Candidatus Falkowbacteria bacterium HGW-Falkowbacteria-2]|uniref:DUF5050 domain-containing protein n=1 Tax=Candidatus Falkowbacteria bacterium HGW-Falkowbacteria-2 TaxID=2013769 RepID=A0A2N2DYT0_9BACT|nr:MAG: hypothetical protein CVU83_02810 [Candidatus Falkowbacteria bacterium HGW-Falkowbacteria-2]